MNLLSLYLINLVEDLVFCGTYLCSKGKNEAMYIILEVIQGMFLRLYKSENNSEII